MKRKLIVVDTETAGFDASQHSILTFGAVIYQEGSIAGTFLGKVAENPLCIEQPVNGVSAFDVNGIKQDEVEGWDSPAQVVQKYVNWLAANDLYGQQMMVAHNISFDSAFLRRLWRLAGCEFSEQWSHRMMCTQSTAILLDQAGRINLPGGSASLDSVAAVLGLKRESGSHNALGDAVLTAKVLKRLIDRLS